MIGWWRIDSRRKHPEASGMEDESLLSPTNFSQDIFNVLQGIRPEFNDTHSQVNSFLNSINFLKDEHQFTWSEFANDNVGKDNH